MEAEANPNVTLEWLKALITRRTQEIWELEKRPYYISFVAVDSAAEGVDYKELIKPLKLRQWALTTDIEGTKVVAHPVHKAKVGFVPAGESFDFEDVAESVGNSDTGSPPTSRSRPVVATRRSTLQFLETLATLPDEELDKVIIPVRTIVRLLHG